MKESKFLIIDGSSVLYRAFFAMPPLQNKKGEHTNAIYGFMNMFMGILKKVQPQYAAVAFDRPVPTFRHELFDQYKAQRESAPSELVEQIIRVKDLIKAFNIPVLEMDGFEADDIIGTLACLAEKEGLYSYLFSGDTDLFQLISEKTRVIMIRRGITDLKEYDLQQLWEKYNLTPEQIIDYKALKGDPSDNIPGVPGVGEKTALKLLHEYGTLEKVLDNSADLKGRLQENIRQYNHQAVLSKKLVAIKCDIDSLALPLDKYRFIAPDYGKVKELFTDLEFSSLLKKLPDNSLINKKVAGREADSPEKEYISLCKIQAVNDISLMREIFSKTDDSLPLTLLVATEGTYPVWKAAPVAIAFSTDNGCGYYLAESLLASGEWKEFMRLAFNRGRKVKILGYNTKKLMSFLKYHGIGEIEPVFDSMLAAYLLDPGKNISENGFLLKEYLNIDISSLYPKKIVSEEDKTKKSIALAEESAHYFRLYIEMLEKIEDSGLDELYSEMELPLSRVLACMERQGISVNKDTLKELSAEIGVTIGTLQKEIFNAAGEEFNLNSPRQLADILFEKLKMPAKKKTKTGYSTDINVLEELAIDYEIADKIVFYRQLVKLEGTYLAGLLPYIEEETKKIYTTFNQAVTTTGRLSSSDPNLQNIPVRLAEGRRIRKAFVAGEEGRLFLAADYSQIELRILAHLSGDPTLVESFLKDEDVHRRTAAEIFAVSPSEVTSEMRKKAKAVNFGIIYGISDYGLSRDIKVSRKEARIYIENYFNRYSGVQKYMEDIVDEARELGYVKTIFGRRREVPEINDKNFSRRGFAERTARNTPIQGSAADIIKLAMLRVYNAIKENGYEARIILQVHDELILELPQKEKNIIAEMVKKEMESASQLNVPLKVDMGFGKNWYEIKEEA